MVDAGAGANIAEVSGAMVAIVAGRIDIVAVLWVVDIQTSRRRRIEVA